tara:strand:- start:122 stop:877 length:756 start_codon:yes stop_codon:yes gene_type:complete
MKKIIKDLLNKLGYKIDRIKKDVYPIDISNEIIKKYQDIEPFTVTSIERVAALLDSVKYIVNNNINGDFVECGVWKGGSCMLIAKELIKQNNLNRNIWLYDTFDGMTQPTDDDIETETGIKGKDLLSNVEKTTEKFNMWAYAPIEEVKNNMLKTNYPIDNIKYIKGKVEDTLKSNTPRKIALLRLDTDWYESTKIELETLYPLITKGGILIIDDYGHFEGAKRAVDDYFRKINQQPLLNRIDYTGRLIIKT